MSEISPVTASVSHFPARVVNVIDEFRVVINRGANHGLKLGQRFMVYSVSEADLVDPETGESLGRLEIVKGAGSVVHVQERLATLRSLQTTPASRRLVRKHPTGIAGLGPIEEETYHDPGEPLPFDDAARGDFARPV